MQKQVLLRLNHVDPNEPPLRKPLPPELPQRMQMGPHLPNALIDIEPLLYIYTPKLRRRQRATWQTAKPPNQPLAASKPPPLKPLPPINPPLPPIRQNRPDIKGRNSKKAEFKVSFVEPQYQQQQQQQQQEEEEEEV